MKEPCPGIKFILFDFGGVLAEEGFEHGLRRIARTHGLDPETFRDAAVEEVYKGYALGRATESSFWETLRRRFEFQETDEELRAVILDGFVPRPWMFETVDRLNQCGLTTAILSDQTDWLEELDRRHGFTAHFRKVFNSWRTGMSKRQPESFLLALDELGAQPSQTLFIDDSRKHVLTARELRLKAIHFDYPDPLEFLPELEQICPCLGKAGPGA